MSSSSSNSGSSAALATVVVTARDIEFSNYNSATGKWGGAVMTMMILDAVTEELEGYNEKVYAVFRNHDDLTDLIEFSPEVDGLDTRVTTTDPMVASAKYELYKVYGETSGGEYATNSQFYFQVPGKVWDFANDTVGQNDITLVSDWFNYGYIKDTNDVIHGVTNKNEMANAVSSASDSTVFTVNGVSMTRVDVKGVKITSMLDSNLEEQNYQRSFLYNYNNLEELDIVSARITRLIERSGDGNIDYDVSAITGAKFNCRFAFPDTLRVAGVAMSGTPFNQPVYFPDSVTRIGTSLYGMPNYLSYNKKVRFSPNLAVFNGYHLSPSYNAYNYPLYPMAENVQLEDFSQDYGLLYSSTSFNQPFTIPSVWTYIPRYFFYNWNAYSQDLAIPDNITSIHNNSIRGLPLKSITFNNTLTSIGTSCFSGIYTNIYPLGTKVIGFQNTKVVSTGNGFFNSCKLDLSAFGFPATLRNIGSGFLGSSSNTIESLPTDSDGFHVFEFPEGIETIGASAFDSVNLESSKKLKIVFPSTITSIGTGLLRSMNGMWYSQSPTTVVKVDFTKISPNVFQDNDTLAFRVASDSYLMPVDIKIAPGTKAQWQAKFPDIPSDRGTGYYWRKINWIEPTTEYGKLVYYPNYTTTWGISAAVGTRQGSDVKIYSVEEFENWIATLSPAPYVSATGDLRFDSPNGQDLQYVDINGDTQTIQYGVWGIPGVQHIDFDYSAPEKYIVFNNNITISTVDQTSTAEVELTSLAQYNSLCMSGIPYIYNTSPVMDYTTRVTVGANSTVIPIACIKSYEFGTVPTTIPNYFLVASSVESVDMSHANITTIGDGFLCDCGYFNSNVDLTGVTSVGTNFLSKCVLFNGTLGDMSSLTAIGTRFLYNCQVFNHPIQLPSAITSLDFFMTLCKAFNQPLDFSHITTIGDEVLNSCKAFNYSLDLSHVTSVGSKFLANCDVYNQPVTIANITSVGSYFLSNCPVFNSQVLLPNCTTFGTGFMQLCTIFNQPINMTNVTNCGAQFLMMCKAFNQPLDLSNLEGAGTASEYGGFLNHCDAFNQTINLPKIRYFGGLDYMASFNSNVTFGPYLAKLSNWSFGYNNKMCKTYDFNTVNPNNVQVGSNNYFNSLFVTTNSSTDAYVNGVKIAGTYRSAWMAKCPNNSSGTFTRRLINAGY